MTDELLVTDIAGELGPEWLHGFNEEIQNEVETEKAKYWVRQSRIAKLNVDLGRQMLPDSLGQKVLHIDSRTWFRWLHEVGHDAMHDPKELYRLSRDNPEWKVPGHWRPTLYKPSETIVAGA